MFAAASIEKGWPIGGFGLFSLADCSGTSEWWRWGVEWRVHELLTERMSEIRRILSADWEPVISIG
jgi:hypothetical protein